MTPPLSTRSQSLCISLGLFLFPCLLFNFSGSYSRVSSTFSAAPSAGLWCIWP
ncbi:PPR repeat [Musa troglodytarum]|uniref:PPR repeat n=1 Tax=Musa troglodytarum TaxID=320322 RepID=A0A9E7JN44_9LILI|nr:PPR repeat [Musa troglodytarum]